MAPRPGLRREQNTRSLPRRNHRVAHLLDEMPASLHREESQARSR
ncbi:hypothetical protein ACP4OV_031435 [Aristida adscensionis]